MALPPTLSTRVSLPQSPTTEAILDCDHFGITPRLVTVPCPVPAASSGSQPSQPGRLLRCSRSPTPGPDAVSLRGLLRLSPSVIAFPQPPTTSYACVVCAIAQPDCQHPEGEDWVFFIPEFPPALSMEIYTWEVHNK